MPAYLHRLTVGGNGPFQPSLPDIAPRTDHIGDHFNGDVHGGFTICLKVELIPLPTGGLDLECCILPAMMISVPFPATNARVLCLTLAVS